MAIAFTQFVPPNGRKQSVGIERSSEIEALATELVSKGVRFEVEVLLTGEASFEAVILDADGDDESLAMEIVPNDPRVTDAVDKLVRDAATAMAGR